MNSNLVICRNEVLIEGVNVGQFETFKMEQNSRSLGSTATLTLPLYAIGANGESRARANIRPVFVTRVGGKTFTLVRPCARIEVYCWYSYWNPRTQQSEDMTKVRVFAGFIEHVVEGYPTTLHLEDNSYVLRFGAVTKAWNEDATLQEIVSDCIPVAQQGFDDERKRLGLDNPIPKLTYSTEKHNVQAFTSPLSMRNWGGRSPFDTVQRLMQSLALYGGVSDDFNVFVGAGVEKNTRPIINLDTRYNVIDRNLTPVDGRFVDYDVKIFGILKSGRRYTATGGYRTSNSNDDTSDFERQYAQSYRGFTMCNTVQGIQEAADNQLESLKGFKNKGSITTLLYPKMQIMDWLLYNDTVFPELSLGYYVLGYQFTADDRGFYQRVEVEGKIFNL